MSKAALAFAAMYGNEQASRFFDMRPKLAQDDDSSIDTSTYSTLEQYAYDFGVAASNFNKGAMAQMQQNPDDTSDQCYTDTLLTNAEIITIIDFSAYYTDSFDVAGFTELAKVMQIAMIQQFESCSVIPFLISFDSLLSNIPAALAGGSNLITQLAIGFGNGNRDSSVFLATDKISEGWNDNRNWETIGGGVLLFMSQLLKISADGSIEVSPTSA